MGFSERYGEVSSVFSDDAAPVHCLSTNERRSTLLGRRARFGKTAASIFCVHHESPVPSINRSVSTDGQKSPSSMSLGGQDRIMISIEKDVSSSLHLLQAKFLVSICCIYLVATDIAVHLYRASCIAIQNL